MSYPYFPDIQAPSYDANNKDDWPGWDEAVIESKAGGYTTSRPANTRLIIGNTWVWPTMPEADFQTLRDFILTTICYTGAFWFTWPVTNETKLVKLTTAPQSSNPTFGTRAVQLSMKEV